MINKKELITKIINKLKNLKKDKLIIIFNNFFNNLKGGVMSIKKKVVIKSTPNPHGIRSNATKAIVTKHVPINPTRKVVPINHVPTNPVPINHVPTNPVPINHVPTNPVPTNHAHKPIIFYKNSKEQILYKNIKTNFNNFNEDYNKLKIYENDLYDKDITYQHMSDSFKIFTILKHMYFKKDDKYLTESLIIFQTVDTYYIYDLLNFVKIYFEKYSKNTKKDIKFIYKIYNNKIYFKLNKYDGIILYNNILNQLDIYLKKNKITNPDITQQNPQMPLQQIYLSRKPIEQIHIKQQPIDKKRKSY